MIIELGIDNRFDFPEMWTKKVDGKRSPLHVHLLISTTNDVFSLDQFPMQLIDFHKQIN